MIRVKGKRDTQEQLWSEEMGKDKEDTFTSVSMR